MPDIDDHFPQKGTAGSPVYLLLEDAIDEELIEELQAFYNDEEIAVTGAFEDTVQVKIPRGPRGPRDAPAGELQLRAGRSSSNTVEFVVAEEEVTQLQREPEDINENGEFKYWNMEPVD